MVIQMTGIPLAASDVDAQSVRDCQYDLTLYHKNLLSGADLRLRQIGI